MNDREKWRERGSGISVLVTWHDDDDDDECVTWQCKMDILLVLGQIQKILYDLYNDNEILFYNWRYWYKI